LTELEQLERNVIDAAVAFGTVEGTDKDEKERLYDAVGALVKFREQGAPGQGKVGPSQ